MKNFYSQPFIGLKCLNIMKFIFLSLLLFLSLGSFAQQEPQYAMFWNNYGSFNPAYSGLENDLDASLTYRQSPRSFHSEITNFNAGYKLKKINSGLGLNFTKDRILQTTNKLNFNYNYQLKIKESILSYGIGIGLHQLVIDPSIWITPSGLDPCNDPAISCKKEKYTNLNINTGAYFFNKSYSFGIGITQINEQKLNYYKPKKHLFLSGLYILNQGNKIQFIPSFLYKTDFNYPIYELNIRSLYNDIFWVGMTYRKNVSLGVMAGCIIKKSLTISYCYDNFTSNWKEHEIAVSFKLNRNQSNSGNTN